MSRGPQSFKQCDVTKALKATEKAGFKVNRIEIDRAGKIVIIAGKSDSAEAGKSDSTEASNSDAIKWGKVK